MGVSRAGQKKKGEQKVNTIEENTRKRNKTGEQKRWKHGDNSVEKCKNGKKH